jgi:hypothetical protein
MSQKPKIKKRYMSETTQGIQVGQKVPDFELTTYDPVKNDFSSISLASLKETHLYQQHTSIQLVPTEWGQACIS